MLSLTLAALPASLVSLFLMQRAGAGLGLLLQQGIAFVLAAVVSLLAGRTLTDRTRKQYRLRYKSLVHVALDDSYT